MRTVQQIRTRLAQLRREIELFELEIEDKTEEERALRVELSAALDREART